MSCCTLHMYIQYIRYLVWTIQRSNSYMYRSDYFCNPPLKNYCFLFLPRFEVLKTKKCFVSTWMTKTVFVWITKGHWIVSVCFIHQRKYILIWCPTRRTIYIFKRSRTTARILGIFSPKIWRLDPRQRNFMLHMKPFFAENCQKAPKIVIKTLPPRSTSFGFFRRNLDARQHPEQLGPSRCRHCQRGRRQQRHLQRLLRRGSSASFQISRLGGELWPLGVKLVFRVAFCPLGGKFSSRGGRPSVRPSVFLKSR
jgi:hypothetical protein